MGDRTGDEQGLERLVADPSERGEAPTSIGRGRLRPDGAGRMSADAAVVRR